MGVLAHLSPIVYPFAMHDSRVLVTGGAGYIGSHTVAALLQAGWEVWVVDDLSGGHREVVPPEATFVQLDLRDEVNLRRVLVDARPAAVIHFAGKIVNPESFRRPLMYYDINVGGSLSLLRAMRAAGVPHLVFSSSAAVYGHAPTQPIPEDTPCAPLSPYGRTKRMVEEILEDLDRADLLRFVSLRYFNAAGADEDGRRPERHRPETHLIPRLLQVAAGDRDVFPLYGTDHPTPDGTAVRDYVHVEDLAEAGVHHPHPHRPGNAGLCEPLAGYPQIHLVSSLSPGLSSGLGV
ncbi:MAG: UDP-glucose 4-epimerase GalE [Candidatus Hydrothermae bacterium]|nr:UDP-glucose 4-epimerase GalE [Candidatus Hydrothermae bacterium]